MNHATLLCGLAAAALSPLVSAQTIDSKCAGNLLAAALPQAKSLNGYTATDVQCVRGQATKIYAAANSEISVQLLDNKGELAGKSEAADPPAIVAMARQMGQMIVDGVNSNLEAGRAAIELVRSDKSHVDARGGPDYVPFAMPLAGGGELIVMVPPKVEASGDFSAWGSLRGRYMVGIEVRNAIAGKDGKAARATLEPFVRAMNFAKLP